MGDMYLTLDEPEVRVSLRVAPRARRLTLRVDPGGAGAVLTVPPGVAMAEARMFLLRQADWLTRALERQPRRIAVRDGTLIPVAGSEVRVALMAGPRRPPKLADGQLALAGPGAPGPRVAAWLKLRARDALAPAAARYAHQLGREVRALSLRDTRSRWGSCSAAGRLGFSWRLAMAPPEVLNYVAAHEAAHLVEMSHGPRFWAVLERILPDYRRHRAWLKREGRRLHAFQFDAE